MKPAICYRKKPLQATEFQTVVVTKPERGQYTS
jgi:hypothetical protein